MLLLLIFIVVIVYVVIVVYIVHVVVVVVYFMLLFMLLLFLLFGLYKQLIFYRFQDSMTKPVASTDTKEIGIFKEKNPHVTRVVFPLTEMERSLPNFALNFRF